MWITCGGKGSPGRPAACFALAKRSGLWEKGDGPGRRNTCEPRQAWKGATVACRLGARDHCHSAPVSTRGAGIGLPPGNARERRAGRKTCYGFEHSPPQGDRMPRLVRCVKLGQELPAIAYKPFSNELGQRIYDNVSQQAWMMWLEFSTRIVNEFRLDLGSAAGQKLLFEQAEQFFFGSGGQTPPDYVP